jgi:hypothetical protein
LGGAGLGGSWQSPPPKKSAAPIIIGVSVGCGVLFILAAVVLVVVLGRIYYAARNIARELDTMPQPIEQDFAELPVGNLPSRTLSNARSTPLVGGDGGGAFHLVGMGDQPCLGVRFSPGNWGGQNVIGSIDPLYESDVKSLPPEPPANVVAAREGYAVGGLLVDAGQYVNAVKLVFYQIQGDRLDPAKSYESDWLGTPTGREPTRLGGTGDQVIGVCGRRGLVVDAIGLVLRGGPDVNEDSN